MQTCSFYQEQISRMIDGDLPEAEQAELHKHLEQCEACRTLYTAFSAISANLAEPELPPVDFSAAIMTQIRQEAAVQPSAKPKKRRFSLRMAATAAGFALILFAASRLPVWNIADNSSEPTMENSSNSLSDGFDLFADDADGSDSPDDSAAGTDTIPSLNEEMEESRAEPNDAEAESKTEPTPAAALYGQLSLLNREQPADWIDALLTLCPLCDVTDGNRAPQRNPDAVYSPEEAAEPGLCELSLWQTETKWILLVQLDTGCFTLEGARDDLQQKAPEACRWISETLLRA